MHNDDYFDEERYYDLSEEYDPFENESNKFDIDDLHDSDE